jgi:GMP synthase-like glutamine amidotransferase
MLLGILQCGHTPDEIRTEHGDFSDLFQALLAPYGFTFKVWNVVDMDFPLGAVEAQAWLVTGSRHGVYEDHDFIPPLEDLIRRIHTSRRPLVGICFGHQIIAQALGGRVEKFKGGWAVGRQTYDLNGQSVHLNAWHQDQITILPPSAQVIGANKHCAYAALTYGQHILTLQPHPELSNPVIADYLRVRGADPTYPPKLIEAAKIENSLPTDDAAIAAQIATFIHTAWEARHGLIE